MRDQHTDTREFIFPETPPQALIEPGDAIVGIGGAFAVGDPVEEVPVVGAFLPHAAHFCGGRLKVSEVLFAQARLFVDFYCVPGERGGGGRI